MAWVKYHAYAADKRNGVHNLEGTTDELRVALSNTAPNAATHAVLADVGELATANGYTVGGIDTQNSGAIATGVLTVTGVFPIVWTASGAGITARYFILFNTTPAGDPLIAYLDRGTSTTVPSGQTLALDIPSDILLTDS